MSIYNPYVETGSYAVLNREVFGYNTQKVFRVEACFKMGGGYGVKFSFFMFHMGTNWLNILSGPNPTREEVEMWDLLGYDTSDVVIPL